MVDQKLFLLCVISSFLFIFSKTALSEFHEETPTVSDHCAITASSLNEWVHKKDKNITIVDTRSANQFALVSIPGSLNLSLRTLQTKEYLREKYLLLIGEAAERQALDKTCKALRSSGFPTTFFLQEGLHAWHHLGLPLQGNISFLKQSRIITPNDFVRERTHSRWITAMVSKTKNPISLPCKTPEINIFAEKSFENTLKTLEVMLRNKLNEDERTYIGILLEGSLLIEKIPQLNQMLTKKKIARTFIIENGVAGLSEFYRKQSLTNSKSEETNMLLQCRKLPSLTANSSK